MERIKAVVHRFDTFQQKHPVLAFPIAVVLKFNKDQAGNQAALLTYYAFLALFPLMLVLFTLIPIVLQNNPQAQQQVLQAVLDYFPIVGDDLQKNIHGVSANGWGLLAGILFALYGARGAANALQHVSNTLWGIPQKKQPGFPINMARSLGIILVGGIGLVATTGVLGYVTGIWDGGWLSKTIVITLALLLNTGVFLTVSRLAVARRIPTRALLLGATISAGVWQILQMVGSLVVLSQLKTAGALYGIFAIVLGLLFWLYLQAQLYLYAVEVSVVHHKKLWPQTIQE